MPAATSIFQALTCEKFENGARLLRADYSIDCTSPKHESFKTFAAVAVFQSVSWAAVGSDTRARAVVHIQRVWRGR